MIKARGVASLFRLGVRQKVLLVLLTVLLIALSINGWFAVRQEEKNLHKEIQQRGSDISRFVAKALSFSVVGYDYHTIQLLLDEVTASDDIDYARVTNKAGHVMAESGELITSQEIASYLFKQVIELDGVELGTLTLGFNTRNTVQRIESQEYSLFGREVLIILLIALGEFIALSFIIIRPLSSMSDALDNSLDENGIFVGKVPVTSRDEFGQLGERFNNLSSQLNQANAQLQSRMQLADSQLIETNRRLLQQSEELREMSDDFKKMSITDALTGLNNRRRFEELMNSEIELSRRYGDIISILVIDIDHFKTINDTYGHPCGDSVLIKFAQELKSMLRITDYLCRIGGEEFVAICRRADETTSMRIAESMRRHIKGMHFSYGDTRLNITISIGVATIKKDSSDEERTELYQNADRAMYHSKSAGRDRVTHCYALGSLQQDQMNTL